MAKSRQRGNGSGTVYRRTPTGPWYASWYDFDGRRRIRCTGTTDKQKALRCLAEWVGDAALRTAGVIDGRQEAIAIESKKPIREHLSAFENKMVAAKRSERHIETTLMLICEVIQVGKFSTPADIVIDPISAHLRSMFDAGSSPRTVRARVVAIKGFVKWLVETGKLQTNPLISLRAPSLKKGRKKQRRMLLPEEWAWLHSATLAGLPWRGVSPVERAMLYATAIQTGLRSNELRSLTKADLRLAGDQPHILCKAENTKNDELAKQHIRTELAEQLRQHVATKAPSARVFDLPDAYRMARMLRDDLANARRAWLDHAKHDADEFARRTESRFLAPVNDQGQALDFHALRHTTGAWLALQGIHPKAIQAVMRHSTITLTLDTYGHLLPDQHADAVASFDSIFSPPMPIAEAVGGPLSAVQIAVAVRAGATSCDDLSGNAKAGGALPSSEVLGFPAETAKNAGKIEESESASCRARTYDPLIKSLLPGISRQQLAPTVSSTDSDATFLAFQPIPYVYNPFRDFVPIVDHAALFAEQVRAIEEGSDD